MQITEEIGEVIKQVVNYLENGKFLSITLNVLWDQKTQNVVGLALAPQGLRNLEHNFV